LLAEGRIRTGGGETVREATIFPSANRDDTDDPNRRDSPYDFNARHDGPAAVWIADAALVLILLALAFGMNHASQTGPSAMQNSPAAISRPSKPPAGRPGKSGLSSHADESGAG
jgi:hypothetical protein